MMRGNPKKDMFAVIVHVRFFDNLSFVIIFRSEGASRHPGEVLLNVFRFYPKTGNHCMLLPIEDMTNGNNKGAVTCSPMRRPQDHSDVLRVE